MESSLTTAREALMAELLHDVDVLLCRLEQTDKALAGKIEQAAKDAAGKAFLSARLNFESMIDEKERNLTDAGCQAARLIHQQLNSGAMQIIAANDAFERKARRFICVVVGIALIAGATGGVMVGKLAGL